VEFEPWARKRQAKVTPVQLAAGMPQDLTSHSCINLRTPTRALCWEFEKDQREMRARIAGPLAFNTTSLVLNVSGWLTYRRSISPAETSFVGIGVRHFGVPPLNPSRR
jgi:hypothetical protein